MSKYEILEPREAALRMWQKLRNDPQPIVIPSVWMEGRHIPDGTFNEFVHELKGMGACIMSFSPGKEVRVCGW